MVGTSLLPTLLLLLLPVSQVSGKWDMQTTSIDTIRYLCEHHTYADTARFVQEKDATNLDVFKCTLTYGVEVGQSEAESVCKYMFASAHLLKGTLTIVRIRGVQNALLTCEHQFLYLCAPGQFPLEDLCFDIQDTEKTYQQAAKDCKSSGGQLLDRKHGDFITKQLLISINPRRLGFESQFYWTEKNGTVMAMGRGLDLSVPGEEKELSGGQTAESLCVKEPMKTDATYVRKCEILKNVLRLPVASVGGTCYMLSSSVYSTPYSSDKPNPAMVYDNDRAVSPLSQTRMDAVDKVLQGSRHELTYVLTTGYKDPKQGGAETANWNILNADGNSTSIFEVMWQTTRPVMKDGDAPNSQVVVIPKAHRGNRLFQDVPLFFRGHLICGTGPTATDAAYKPCDPGWRGVRRDDGTVICVKAFHQEMTGKKYSDVKAICQRFNASLAATESADEMQLITELLKELKSGVGSVWLGATLRADGKFYWDLDGKPVTTGGVASGTNWAGGEPNNAGGIENCLQMYTPGGNDGWDFKWNDTPCDTERAAGDRW